MHLPRKPLQEFFIAEGCREALLPRSAEVLGPFSGNIEDTLQKVVRIGGIDRAPGHPIHNDLAPSIDRAGQDRMLARSLAVAVQLLGGRTT